jgi:hypothetical protein
MFVPRSSHRNRPPTLEPYSNARQTDAARDQLLGLLSHVK